MILETNWKESGKNLECLYEVMLSPAYLENMSAIV
jgi:hypothetical protein